MDHDLNSEGVCCTCSLRSNCLSFKNSKLSRRPIQHCEEFDDVRENAAGEKKRGVAVQRNIGDTGADSMVAPSAKGLCVNCDDAGICKFAGFGDEVVFCEEHSANFENAHSEKMSHRIFANVPNLAAKNLLPGWDA